MYKKVTIIRNSKANKLQRDLFGRLLGIALDTDIIVKKVFKIIIV